MPSTRLDELIAGPDSEVVIGAARRRQRIRRTAIPALVLAAGGVIAAVLVGSGGIPAAPMPPLRSPSPPPASVSHRGPPITSVAYDHKFVPTQVVADKGKVWVSGHFRGRRHRCALQEIDPTTLHSRFRRLPACADQLVAGGPHLYFDVVGNGASEHRGAPIHRVWVGSYDIADHASWVSSKPAARVEGSADAHIDFSYGEHMLWFYGQGIRSRSPHVIGISTSTGSQTRVLSHAQSIGGTSPSVVADTAGVWTAGGPGSVKGSKINFYPKGSSQTEHFHAAGQHSFVEWLAPVGHHIWASVLTDRQNRLHSRLVAFAPNGHRIVESPRERAGDVPLVHANDHTLWSFGTGKSCDKPQRLIGIDARTGRSSAIAKLPTPVAGCFDEFYGSHIAAIGKRVFVLEALQGYHRPSRLYRVTH